MDYSSECLHAVLESLQLGLGSGALRVQCINLVATAALVSHHIDESCTGHAAYGNHERQCSTAHMQRMDVLTVI